MKTNLLASTLQLLLMHFLLIVGLYRQLPLPERLALYPQLLGAYLLGGLILAWCLSSHF